MPIFYNQGNPTPATKNNINDIAVTYGIRDFLLNLNLAPQYPFIQTNVNGSPRIGEPVLDTMVGSGALTVPIGLPLETNGLLFKDLNTILNTFQPDPNIANVLTEINYNRDILNTDYLNSEWPLGGPNLYPTTPNSEINQYGILAKTTEANYKKANVIKNLYLDESKQIDMSAFIDFQPLDISQQIPSYLDVFGGLNQGGSAGEQAVNILGSVLNGQGIGIGNNGNVIPNFDIRSSLAGRVLGATGFLKDTKLGTIGGQQLALALANNAAFNVEQDLLGSLNIGENILNLIKDGSAPAFRPSYKITVAKSTGGQLLTSAASILGFQIPRSYLDDDGSIFQSENGDVANIDRANSMILNTGKGQIKSLITNVRASSAVNGSDNPFRSGYVPGYKDKGKDAVTSADTKLYAFSTDNNKNVIKFWNKGETIPEISYNREAMTKNSGFESPEINGTGPKGNTGYDNRKISDVGFTWTTKQGAAINHINESTSVNNNEIVGDKKSLLVKTQKLFNNAGMKTLVSVKGEMGVSSSQIQTANNDGISKGSAVLASGRYNLNSGRVNSSGSEADNNFCRSWTTLDRYDSVKNLIRNKPLYDSEKAPYRFNVKNSVLGEGGFVKIAPYTDDSAADPKKFMFSIENLAWAGDSYSDLPKCEQGPGDLTTGKAGRIMWFPPYDINFTENNTLDWESNKFIGRGEPVYTYNNTERSGTLSFKVIVDHPSYFNAFRGESGPDDNYIASYFAGCVDPTEGMIRRLLNVSDASEIVSKNIPVEQAKQSPVIPPTVNLRVYFPNDNYTLDQFQNYENGLSGSTQSGLSTAIDYTTNPSGLGYGIGSYPANVTQVAVKGKTDYWDDRYNFGLNWNSYNGKEYDINGQKYFGYYDPNTNAAIVSYLKNECIYCTIKTKGYASPQGFGTPNTTLAENRAKYIVEQLKANWGPSLGLSKSDLDKRFKTPTGEAKTKSGCPVQTAKIPNPPTDILECKLDRYVEITIEYDSEYAAEKDKALHPAKPDRVERTRIRKELINKFYGECGYFDKMVEDNPFVFDSVREKIKYFHPAFHSTTPEGLNSRLTFLLQCTRQGPTLESQGANNLAFGRAPVCILRIGDFYHTKIIMENLNIDYEPLVWDLNPEGIGVQPMIANVDISFKFLGGSSLYGPINKLQNALSFNYFANTHVYDPRADYIATKRPSWLQSEKDSNGEFILRKIQAPLSDTGYYINDGVLSYDPEEVIISTQIISDENKTVDQIRAEFETNGGVENTVATTTTPTYSDDEVLKCIKLESYRVVSEGDTVFQLGVGFYPKDDKPGIKFLLTDATKTYKAKISLNRLNSKNITNLESFTAKQKDANSTLFNGVSEVVVNSTENSWVIEIPLSSDNLSVLLTAKDDTSAERYSLQLTWDVQSASNIIGYLSAVEN